MILERPELVPPWLVLAERHAGRRELERGKLSAFVAALFAHTRFPLARVTNSTPWCAAFVCSMLEDAGIRSPKSARARDFLRWGVAIRPIVAGAVLVFPRGKAAGHVGFALGPSHQGYVDVLGGNQRNRVCVDRRRALDALDVRWPTEVAIPEGAITLCPTS